MKKPFRLFWGENYIEKPKVVQDAIDQALLHAKELINLYPDTEYDETQELIARTHKLTKNQVILGHGVEGLVNLICQTYLGSDKIGGMFDPSFFVYENNLKRYKYVKLPCRHDKKVNLKDVLTEIQPT